MKRFFSLFFALAAVAAAQVATIPWEDVAKPASVSSVGGLTPAANKFPYYTGASTAALADVSAFAFTFLDDANAAAVRTTLGLVIGTDVLAPNGSGASLTALNASQLASGTIPDARFPATLPALSGLNLTALNASNLGSGTVPVARLPVATTSAVGAVQLATNAEAVTGTDAAKSVTPAAYKFAAAPLRNALAPRGGVAFEGSPSNRVTVPLTAQSIGTDDFSVVYTFRTPTANASGSPTCWSIGTDATDTFNDSNTVAMSFDASGGLTIQMSATFATHYRAATIANFVSTHGGKLTQVAAVRAGTVLKIYVNGVDTAFALTSAGTDPTWAMSVTSNYLHIGYQGTNNVANWPVYSASLYNLALSANEIVEVYELGGAVPYRYQWGSQAPRYTSDFSSGIDSWIAAAGTPTLAGNQDGVGGQNDALKITATASSYTDVTIANATFIAALQLGKVYRVRWSQYHSGNTSITGATLAGTSGGTLTNQYGVALGVQTSASGSWSNIEQTFMTALVVGQFSQIRMVPAPSVTSGDALYVRNLTLQPVGAVLHLPLDDGIGYQLHDASTNKLDGVMTTTGAYHLIARTEGYVRGTLTWAATHEGKSLLGQQALPANAVVTYITTRANAGASGSGMTIGTTGTAARWVATTVFANAAKKLHTLANQIPHASSGGVVTANDLDVIVDPDTVNFTGSQDVTVRYVVTDQNAP